MTKELISSEVIEQRIFFLRGHKILIDKDLAELYGISTKVLVQAVKRNIDRFPNDFMFRLKKEEFTALRSQFVTSNRGGRKYLPYAFTEQGVAMLSSVLKSKRAVQVNVAIMRTFVKLREVLSSSKELSYKLDLLERKIEKHDEEITVIFEAIRELMKPPDEKPKRGIGFHVKYD